MPPLSSILLVLVQRGTWGLFFSSILLTLTGTGCFDRAGTGPSAQGCNGCHGDADSAAPPFALGGITDPLAIGVGAHRAHLTGAVLGSPVACGECHLVPGLIDTEGHIDTPWPAEVKWGEVAKARGRVPDWDRETQTCANGWCHGQDTPVWTANDGAAAVCGSCHSLPPAAPHPANPDCQACHAPTAGPDMTIADPSTHVNGQVEVTGMGCTGCHGSDMNPAPPVDLQGGSDTTSVRVGAHQTHLRGGMFSKAVACTDCHLEVLTVQSPGHTDTRWPAEVDFAGVAIARSSTASWDREAETCNTYCHFGGAPKWTVVDGTEAACGSCHALPPPAPHPGSMRCNNCHAPVGGEGNIILDPSRHVDGILDLNMPGATCASGCHGSGMDEAPPTDLAGGSATTSLGVGAHRAHLSGGVFSKAVACIECHVAVTAVNDPGHTDTATPAEVLFGALADEGGITSEWDRDAATCNTYCHGLSEPVWTTVDGTEAACGTCHALPPPAPHPAVANCQQCHGSVAGANQTIAVPERHIDGNLDF